VDEGSSCGFRVPSGRQAEMRTSTCRHSRPRRWRAALLQMQHEPMRTSQRTAEQAAAAPGAKSRNQVGNTLMQGAGRAHAVSTPLGVKLLGVANASRRCGLAASPRPPRATRRNGSGCRATAWRATPSAASSLSMSRASTWAKTRSWGCGYQKLCAIIVIAGQFPAATAADPKRGAIVDAGLC